MRFDTAGGKDSTAENLAKKPALTWAITRSLSPKHFPHELRCERKRPPRQSLARMAAKLHTGPMRLNVRLRAVPIVPPPRHGTAPKGFLAFFQLFFNTAPFPWGGGLRCCQTPIIPRSQKNGMAWYFWEVPGFQREIRPEQRRVATSQNGQNFRSKKFVLAQSRALESPKQRSVTGKAD